MTLLFILHTCVAAARTVECAVVDPCAVLLIKHLRTTCGAALRSQWVKARSVRASRTQAARRQRERAAFVGGAGPLDRRLGDAEVPGCQPSPIERALAAMVMRQTATMRHTARLSCATGGREPRGRVLAAQRAECAQLSSCADGGHCAQRLRLGARCEHGSPLSDIVAPLTNDTSQ